MGPSLEVGSFRKLLVKMKSCWGRLDSKSSADVFLRRGEGTQRYTEKIKVES